MLKVVSISISNLPVKKRLQSPDIKFILHASTICAWKYKISQGSKTWHHFIFRLVHRSFNVKHAKVIIGFSKNVILKSYCLCIILEID